MFAIFEMLIIFADFVVAFCMVVALGLLQDGFLAEMI